MIARIKNAFKMNPLLYFLVTLIKDKNLRKNYRQYFLGKAKGRKKSRSVVLREVKLVRDYWKCPSYHYFRYKLFDKDLSREQLLDYVPAYYFYNYHMKEVYRNMDLSIIEDKIRAHQLFTNKRIPTPVLIAYVKKKKIIDKTDNEISLQDLISHMKLSEAERFFCKPATGKGGSGIFVVTKSNGDLKCEGFGSVEEKLFSSFTKGDYIIQEGIIQRLDISALNSSSVNTLRIITQIIENVPRISIAIIRIGRNSMFVDNSSKGGISVEIDRETGKLNKYAYTEHNMQIFDHHPDTGIIFEKIVIKNWPEIKTKICKFAEKLSMFKELAWDIAISIDDVIVIEVNSYYGIDHLQCCSGGVAKKLHLKIPY